MATLFGTVSAEAAWQTPAMPTQEMAAAQAAPAVGVTATVSEPYFKITADDVAKAVAEQLQLQAIEEKADVNLAAGLPKVLYTADHPLKLAIHALQVDTQSQRWQGQVYVLANGKTETVKPVSGTYMGMMEVPVLTRQLGRNDVIEASDLTMKAVLKSQLRKETVTDSSKLIGQSPRAVISANRPIRMSEVNSPIVIKKGDAVQMTYTNPYMSLKATGVALQDGAKGEMIRVKNDKSEKAISGRIQGAGHIEVNQSSAL
jgi:flagella basal body P-ring formation protein FlgA